MVDERSLVDRCLAGDREGLRAFVECFQNAVFSVCFRYLGQHQDAEDVAQEALVRAVKHLRHWDGVRPLKPWVLMIAVNRCRTHLSKRRPHVQQVDSIAEPAASRGDVSQLDLAEELQKALDGLRDNYRTCFLLFHQQELSIQDVAELMECPEGTIKTWLHRARRELASRLRERGVVTEDGHELFRV